MIGNARNPGFGPLEALLSDASITEVLVNGGGRAWVERAGRLERVSLALDEAAVRALVERIIAPLGLRLDRSSPMVDARLPDGSRLHAVLAPVAVEGTCLAIRRFRAEPWPLSSFGAAEGIERFLAWIVEAGWNVLVSGGTGAGKTSLLASLCAFAPQEERIVTIEETAELRLGHGHVVRLEARPPNAEGAGAVSIRDLVRAALRLRPDRLIIGEVRGGEAFDMVQALNTGHDGSLCTIHANGCGEALARLEALMLLAGTGVTLDAARRHIAACVDAIVHVARRRNGVRAIEVVAEVVPEGVGAVARPLFAGGSLPTRSARRPEAPPWQEGWFQCA